MPNSRIAFGLTALIVALGVTWLPPALAKPLVITGTGQSTAPIANCTNTIANFHDCVSTAFVSKTDATETTTFLPEKFNGTAPTTQTFKTAFDNWNAAQTTGVTWALVNGGALDKLTLTVNPFTAAALNNVGGISNITVTVTVGNGYAGPLLDELVWTQALYTNDSPSTAFGSYIVPPAVLLDDYSFNHGGAGAFTNPCQALPAPPASSTNERVNIPASPANTAYCDPIYPFQYADKHFFDAPEFGWPSASFRAIALLSTVSETTDAAGKVTAATLTVYDGVNYGFDLTVPEPSSILLLSGGLLLLFPIARRRRRAR